MNISFNHTTNDKILFFGFILSLTFLTLAFSYTLFYLSKLPPYLPLFNQLAWGQPRLGTKNELFIPLGISLVIVISNFFLSNVIYSKSPLLSRMLCATTVLISFFILLFVIRTIQLVA